ncbi:MAG: P27 family phage terminase small subunit [Bacteroidaceae bacterium]|nr:P27 family phage terminase small subunit [Bacteroidaceae bacterium]
MDIDKHMRAVRKYLKEEKHLTKVDEMTLELLRSDLETLDLIKKELANSMTTVDQYGRTIPSPFLREKDRVIKRVLEYEKKLGLSPYDRKKLEVESADEKSPLEQFIDAKPTDPFNLPNQLDLFDPDEL